MTPHRVPETPARCRARVPLPRGGRSAGRKMSDQNLDVHGVARDRALARIIAEIHAGLRHGYFEYTLTCEVISQGDRRLVLHAGKNYQFVIPAAECEPSSRTSDPHDGGANHAN
jgi:hypothetical protein